MRFEDSLRALERIVEELEREELPLEEALSRFEEGMRLAGHCHRLLAEAERRVEVLVREAGERFVAVPLEEETCPPGSSTT